MKLNEYWFKPKRYGYGAYPITWEGWAVVLVFFLFLVWRSETLINIDPGRFYFEVIVSVIALIWISKLKTEEEWKWRWG
ncbi:hypothetical protein C0585_06030 [Candidatus Woesearchaeota archaeon]|nr:MAG: hypothetical protein C0585_06030 [Candidatus Woesearchaeota archaeon]